MTTASVSADRPWGSAQEVTDLVARFAEATLRLGARDLPLRHYSEARLKSAEARAGWVEPDLRPMPETTVGGSDGRTGAPTVGTGDSEGSGA
jgi:hypothetical protein